MKSPCVSVAVLWISLTFVAGQTKWNGLRTTFNVNPFGKYRFSRLPRLSSDALADGFVKIDDCSTSAPWRGNRYIKDDDAALILLYDVNGYIAGMQTGLPKTLENGYPQEGQMPPFVEDGPTRFVMSAYFVDPAIICASGRTSIEFADQGTGTDLYVQNGTDPETDYIIVPRQEKDIVNTKWTLGRCFPFMGTHYWHDISFNMDCKKLFPIFPLYNRGELTAFGFILMANMPSQRYEQPPALVYPLFFLKVPHCAYYSGRITSIHVYLTNNVFRNLCGPVGIGSMG